MAIPLVSCPECGTKNSADGFTCLKCGVELFDLKLFDPELFDRSRAESRTVQEEPGKRGDVLDLAVLQAQVNGVQWHLRVVVGILLVILLVAAVNHGVPPPWVLSVAVVILLVTTVHPRSQPAGPRVLRVRGIEVEDDGGRTRITLGVEETGGGLVLRNRAGKTLVQLSAHDVKGTGGILWLYDPRSSLPRVLLHAGFDKGALAFYTQKGGVPIHLGVDEHDSPWLRVEDASGVIFEAHPYVRRPSDL